MPGGSGRLPDLIVELLSPSTERIDRKTKMSLYAQVFRTRDYFLFGWDKETLAEAELKRLRALLGESGG